MFWGLILVYPVLVLLFRGFLPALDDHDRSAAIARRAPVIGLLVAGQPISLFVFIGIVMLVGIVTKNSILLVDFAVEQRNGGGLERCAL
ncbi:MAG: efflux RND transporter permease subunit [Parvularculaceae bacterium]